MNPEIIENTLDTFLRAWENKSIESVVNLLSEKFDYYETPLEKPLTTKEQIIKLWKPVEDFEADISLKSETMYISSDFGLFRIRGTYTEADKNKKFLIDRIFLLSVDEKGLMTKFMQWRESKEE